MKNRTRRRPCLILFMGVAGSGKTTLARAVLQRFSAVYLDNNHIVDAFFPETRNGRAYERLRPAFYRALYRIAEENLKVGNSVLLDVPHVKEVQRAQWRESIKRLVARARATRIVVRCVCSEEALMRRIRSRAERRDRWKLRHWSAFLSEQPIRAPIPWRHLDVDTEKPLEANVGKVLAYMRSRFGGRPRGGGSAER
jgi:predicted kinase